MKKNDQKTSRENAAIARNGRKSKDVNGEVKLALRKNRVFIVSKKGLRIAMTSPIIKYTIVPRYEGAPEGSESRYILALRD